MGCTCVQFVQCLTEPNIFSTTFLNTHLNSAFLLLQAFMSMVTRLPTYAVPINFLLYLLKGMLVPMHTDELSQRRLPWFTFNIRIRAGTTFDLRTTSPMRPSVNTTCKLSSDDLNCSCTSPKRMLCPLKRKHQNTFLIIAASIHSDLYFWPVGGRVNFKYGSMFVLIPVIISLNKL